MAAMRQLKSRADTVRQRLDREASDVKRGQLEAELGELRDRWRELAIRRESAYRRKMVMLGHLPPKALLE